MKTITLHACRLFLALTLAASILACNKKADNSSAGTAERVGIAADTAASNTVEAAKRTAEAVKDASDRAVDKTGEVIEKAGDTIKDAGEQMQK